MRAIDSVWIALEVGQKAVLAAPSMPETAFFWRLIVWHCWPHWFLRYANLGFWVWFDAPRICDFVCFTLSLHILLLWDQNFFIFRIFFIRVLIAECLSLRRGSFFHWESGKTFVISKDPFFPHTYLNPKNTTPEKWWSFTIPKYNLILFAAVTFRDETNLFVSMPNICKIPL